MPETEEEIQTPVIDFPCRRFECWESTSKKKGMLVMIFLKQFMGKYTREQKDLKSSTETKWIVTGLSNSMHGEGDESAYAIPVTVHWQGGGHSACVHRACCPSQRKITESKMSK